METGGKFTVLVSIMNASPKYLVEKARVEIVIIKTRQKTVSKIKDSFTLDQIGAQETITRKIDVQVNESAQYTMRVKVHYESQRFKEQLSKILEVG